MIIINGLFIILLPLVIKFVYESPHFIISKTGNHDLCKYVLNGIADVNDEEPIIDRLSFSLN